MKRKKRGQGPPRCVSPPEDASRYLIEQKRPLQLQVESAKGREGGGSHICDGLFAKLVEREDALYLYMRTKERAHTPKHLWEKVALSRNLTEASKQLERHLQAWPEPRTGRVRRELEGLLRSASGALAEPAAEKGLRNGTKLATVRKKMERRDSNREKKAELAAKVPQSVEQELLRRLRGGVYGDVHKFKEPVRVSEDEVKELRLEEAALEEEVEYGEEDEVIAEVDDAGKETERCAPRKKKRRKLARARMPIAEVEVPRVELEYEEELA